MAVLSRSSSGAGSERRREAERGILAATQELLAEGASFAELSVEQISARAGRPRTAFYLYFRDKRELLVRLTRDVSDRLYEQADRWWSGEDARADLRAALTDILVTYREHADLLRAVVEASSYDEEIGDFWRDLLGRFIAATEERLVADGEPREAAAAKAFALTWMTERSCYQQVARASRVDDDALVDALVSIWERGAYGDPGG